MGPSGAKTRYFLLFPLLNTRRGGPEIRWILSVGWCPSKRVVVIHCARPYTAQKVSGGCVTAISGSAPKFAEDT